MPFSMKRILLAITALLAQQILAHEDTILNHSFHPLELRSDNQLLQSVDVGGDADLQAWVEATNRDSSAALHSCPQECSKTTNSTTKGGWNLFSEFDNLKGCNETLLVDVVIDSGNQAGLRACSAHYRPATAKAYITASDKAAICSTHNHELTEGSIRLSSRSQHGTKFATNHAVDAIQQVNRYISSQLPSCKDNVISFSYSQSVVVGVYAGVELHQHGLTSQVLDKLASFVKDASLSTPTVLQLCPRKDLGADYTLGIVLFGSENFEEARNTIKSWSKGSCDATEDGSQWMTTQVRLPLPLLSNSSNILDSKSNETSTHSTPKSKKSLHLHGRAECKTTDVKPGDGCWAVAQNCGISQDSLQKYNPGKDFCNTLVAGQKVCCSSGTLPSSIPKGNSDGTCKTKEVQSGDTCDSLASKCGISGNDFNKINQSSNMCSTLAVGQLVCCSEGKLPDRRPKPNPDGSCASHKVEQDEGCSSIAASRGLTIQDLNEFNKNTWGWNGCDILFLGFRLCVSKGTPPMPEEVSNAVCGPTVPGTKRVEGKDLADLNPCPLKACCNVWGQCGLTEDFCQIKASKTGAPGTSALHNGCVSNCGLEIVKGSPPAVKINIAYFEAWNGNRSCLTMDVDQIDTKKYTHIHFAFAEVTKNFQVDISKVQKQFEKFKAMSGVKKIISFGGWDFSALPGTFNILREAVQPQNRDAFKNNIVNFVNQHQLDGVDIDWEYPGAPDIPDIPSDDPKNGLNYMKFLISLKNSLDNSKTVSFAAPASYWYLKAYPIESMAKFIDYIVFMTYDLHGQWDYGNKWTSPGCNTGNCLRSHVNETETMNALAMITKAGVSSNKVVVGVASYGRSFKMVAAGCTGPSCKFTGSPRLSNAYKGRCTQTAGYISNAEISEIISNGRVTQQWKTDGSNIMVFNETEWVSYMDDDLKASRSKTYDSYNFAGTTDWAVDLQSFRNGSGDDPDDDGDFYIDEDYLPECGSIGVALAVLNSGHVPAHCVDQYLMSSATSLAEKSIEKYKKLMDGGYDEKFAIYERYIREITQPQIDAFMASDQVDTYFKCTEIGSWQCCGDCHYDCQYVPCVKFKGCVSGPGKRLDLDKCPQAEDGYDFLDATTHVPNITFTLKDRKGFFNVMAEKYGIEESWISMSSRKVKKGNGCQYAGADSKHCLEDSFSRWYEYPTADKINVYNPKEIFGDSLEKAQEMLGSMQNIRDVADYDDVLLWSDAADAVSLPAYSLQMGIGSMEQIIDKAKDISKHEREEFILNMVMGILFFVPFVGEAGAAGTAAARSVINLIEGVGDAALTIYGIVKDPKDAFGAIFGFLLGNVGLSNKSIRSAADKKRTIPNERFKDAAPIKQNLDLMEKLRAGTCVL